MKKKSAKDKIASDKPDALKLTESGQKIRNMAALITGVRGQSSRLLVDMPLSDTGETRVTLIEEGRRISAWGNSMEEALTRLNKKIIE